MAKKHNPGCRCCSCNYAADNFDRVDTVLGDKWDVRAGAPTIIANKAVLAANEQAIHVTPGELTDPLVAEAWISAPSNNDVARLIIGRLDDSNYLFVEIIFTGATSTVRLWKRVAGVETALAAAVTVGLTLGFTQQVRLCYRIGALSCTVNNGMVSQTVAVTAPGAQAGIATGAATSTITFDDFSIARGKDSSRPQCPACAGGCTHCADGGAGIYKTVFAGIGANACLNPPGELNGTRFLRTGAGGACLLGSDTVFGSPCALGQFNSSARIEVSGDATHVTIKVVLRLFCSFILSGDVVYEIVRSKPFNCLSISDLVIPYTRVENWSCGPTAGVDTSQCTLTAL